MKNKKTRFFLRTIRLLSPEDYQRQKHIRKIVAAVEKVIAQVKPLEKIIIEFKQYKNKRAPTRGEGG